MDERYKKRGLKFNNNLDSRVLRAVHHQQRQRGRRDEVVNSRRQMGTLQDSPQVSGPPKIPVKSVDKDSIQYKKGMERYQQLLKWKEMKKKQLEKEKKKRMPAFKTGVYHPSPPKYLVSEDQQKELCKTSGASVKKRIATPGTSLRKVPVFHPGGTPGTSLLRVPQFHTGVTPKASTKKHISTTRKQNKPQEQAIARRTRRAHQNVSVKAGGRTGAGGRNKKQRKTDEEELGVQPLQFTPPPDVSRRKLEKSVPSLQGQPFPSFAPADFAFNFEASQIAKTEYPSSACPDDLLAPPHVQEASQDDSSDKKDCKLIGSIEYKVTSIESGAVQEKTMSFQENDAKFSEACESEDQPANQEHSSLQEETSKTKTHLPVTQENSLLQEERDALVSETCVKETQENSSPQEEENAHTSEICENAQPASQENSSPKQDRCADIPQASACEIVVNEALAEELPEDLKANENSGTDPSFLNDEKEMDEEPNVDEHKDSIESNQMAEDDHIHMSITEVQSAVKSKPRRSSRMATPARRVTRKSVACCFDSTVTPTVSRLRPRTPCSRSTRRSLSAHCDSPHELYTPGRRFPAKKTPRYSVSKAKKQNLETHDTSLQSVMLSAEVTAAEGLCGSTEAEMVKATESPLPRLHPQKTPRAVQLKDSPLMTPENEFRREQGMWTVETSPWVSAQRSKKRRKSPSLSDLHGMFDDIATDGTPVSLPQPPDGAVSGAADASVGEDTVCVDLLPLLQPSTPHCTDSPDIDVWGESPALSAPATPKTSNIKQPPQDDAVVPEEAAGDSEDLHTKASVLTTEDPAAPEKTSTSSDGNENAGHRRGRRKSRKSVMFAIEEQENVKSSRLPGTPLGPSSRVSLGLFAKIDMNAEQSISEGQDLMAFESPKSEKKTSSGARKSSSRISLLPGMTPSPKVESAAPVLSDLMTWDSPETRRASRFAAADVATPLRRSRRLSKAV